MLADQLILDLERIQFLQFFSQFRHFRNAVEPHQTRHFCQHTAHVKINHRKIAPENLVGYIIVLQDSSQALDHQHPADHIVFLTKRIDLVDGRYGKLHSRLLELEVR